MLRKNHFRFLRIEPDDTAIKARCIRDLGKISLAATAKFGG